jgi:hypothetical protein
LSVPIALLRAGIVAIRFQREFVVAWIERHAEVLQAMIMPQHGRQKLRLGKRDGCFPSAHLGTIVDTQRGAGEAC